MTLSRRSFLMAAPAVIAAPVLMKLPRLQKPQLIVAGAHPSVLWPSLNDHLLDATRLGIMPTAQDNMKSGIRIRGEVKFFGTLEAEIKGRKSWSH